ncbi:hypothetical protein [Burkholderia gladioli]|uniref:hypothetical protein n=1 Tax=Burkholderia gladioli TaxID=28095 RepID=UPI001641C04C|nr:hypothetical protein [Burkholderia gladioli]MBU9186692.1 hypothetical protein [Burkholderia gladioli]
MLSQQIAGLREDLYDAGFALDQINPRPRSATGAWSTALRKMISTAPISGYNAPQTSALW